MKKLLVAAVLTLSLGNAFAQTFSEAVTAVTMLPSATATKLTESAIGTIVSPFATTSATVQARGVAGKEQLRDDLAALDEDIRSGAVKSIADVRQPALKELFAEIAENDEEMAEINAVVQSGSELHRIATAVTIELMVH
jgi:hypothetical protein